jgi:hypothetical protein
MGTVQLSGKEIEGNRCFGLGKMVAETKLTEREHGSCNSYIMIETWANLIA